MFHNKQTYQRGGSERLKKWHQPILGQIVLPGLSLKCHINNYVTSRYQSLLARLAEKYFLLKEPNF
jgi:hypothetical protein